MSKKYETKFLGETFSFSDKKTLELFDRVKNSIGRGKLISAKNEKGTLSSEDLNGLVEASKPKDTRLNVREDGEFRCVFFHAGNGGQIKAQAWTLTKRDSGEVVTDRDGNPVIAGPFFVRSTERLSALPEVLGKMEKLTGEITGQPVKDRKALIGCVCGFHRSKAGDEYRELIGRTTGKVEAVAALERLESFIGGMAESNSARDAERNALKAAKDAKFAKGKHGDRGGNSEKKFQFEVSFGSVTFGARTEGEARLYKQLADEFRGRELEFSKLTIDELVRRGVSEGAAPALLRRVKQSVTSAATLGERAAANEEQERREKAQRRDRREKVQKTRKSRVRFEGEDEE